MGDWICRLAYLCWDEPSMALYRLSALYPFTMATRFAPILSAGLAGAAQQPLHPARPTSQILDRRSFAFLFGDGFVFGQFLNRSINPGLFRLRDFNAGQAAILPSPVSGSAQLVIFSINMTPGSPSKCASQVTSEASYACAEAKMIASAVASLCSRQASAAVSAISVLSCTI